MIVAWNWPAPASTPAMLLATARPKSSWQCTLTSLPGAACAASLTSSAILSGVATPTVSGTSITSAPARETAEKTSRRNAGSLLVASSAENSTSTPWDLAYSTADTALSSAFSLLIFSLYCR